MEQNNFVLTDRMRKEINSFSKKVNKVWENTFIKVCYETKKENPKISLRQLGKRYEKSKDTIVKWLSKGEEALKEFHSHPPCYNWILEEKRQIYYAVWTFAEKAPDPKEIIKDTKRLKWIALERGVKKNDFESWKQKTLDEARKHLMKIETERLKLTIESELKDYDEIKHPEKVDDEWADELINTH